MVALLRIVDSVRCKELGRQAGRRSSPMEQTLKPKLIPGKRWRGKKAKLHQGRPDDSPGMASPGKSWTCSGFWMSGSRRSPLPGVGFSPGL